MENSLRLFLSLADPAHVGFKRDCPFASPSPSPETSTSFPHSPPPTPLYPYLSNYATAPPTGSLLDKPRAPPPWPIPLSFPRHEPKSPPQPLSRQSMRDFRRAILSARRPTDNTDAVFDLLNVQLISDVPLDSPDLIPANFLPHRPFLYDADLESMLAELSIENEDAFREVLRQKPKEGRPKPRIAYSRNFFGTLEDMSRYCDASTDNYYETEDEDPEAEHSEAKDPSSTTTTTATTVDGQEDSEMDDQPDNTAPAAAPNTTASSATAKKTKPVYTGIRLGNTAQLPPSTRTSAVRNLLKMAMHKFTCRDYDLSPRERLRVRDINIPPPLASPSFIVARLPADRALARARHVEGPLLGVCVRHEVVFDEVLHRRLVQGEGRDRGEVGECLGAKVDLLREVGAALAVAMQRAREGRKREEELDRLVKHWWWTTERRWGGGPTRWGMLANEVFEDEDPSWSPVERELQARKREKAQAEMRKVDEMAEKVEGGLKVQDMLAKSEEMAAQPSPSSSNAAGRSPKGGAASASALNPGVGLLSRSSQSIPTLTPTLPAAGPAKDTSSSAGGGAAATTTTDAIPASDVNTPSNAASSSDPSTAPDRPPKKKHRLGLADRLPEHLLSTTSAFSSSPSSSSSSLFRPPPPTSPSSAASPSSQQQAREDKRERDMAERAEFRDGRRLMYTAPMRRKWFREWTNVRPNAVGWDEKVIWRRVGGPEGGKGDGQGKQQQQQQQSTQGLTAVEGKEEETVGKVHKAEPAVGEKEPGKKVKVEQWDDIFQVSCVNHHVSLTKMRVSARYLRWLENGDADADAPLLSRTTTTSSPWTVGKDGAVGGAAGGAGRNRDGAAANKKGGGGGDGPSIVEVRDEDVLRVWRSEYYDLFDVERRKEFFVALWRAMSYLCRNEVPEAEWLKVSEAIGKGEEKGKGNA